MLTHGQHFVRLVIHDSPYEYGQRQGYKIKLSNTNGRAIDAYRSSSYRTEVVLSPESHQDAFLAKGRVFKPACLLLALAIPNMNF